MRRVAAPVGLSLPLALALALAVQWGAVPARAEDPLQGLGLDSICQNPSASADLPADLPADQAQALREACAEMMAARGVAVPPVDMAIPDDHRPVEQQLDDLKDRLESLDDPP